MRIRQNATSSFQSFSLAEPVFNDCDNNQNIDYDNNPNIDYCNKGPR